MGGKLKIKQWKIIETKGTKFSDTNRGQLGGNGQKRRANSIHVLELIPEKFAILTFTKNNQI